MGCDSKTTLACAKGQYEHYQYFSYISQEAEAVDAEGAHAICEKLGLKHTIYTIPEQSAKEQELVRKIIRARTKAISAIPICRKFRNGFTYLAELF